VDKTRKNTTKQLTHEQTKHNQTLWGRIELVKYDQKAQTWTCAIRNCAKKHKNTKAMGQHLEKHRKGQTIHSQQTTHRPYCNKKYTNLDPTLIHLELREKKNNGTPVNAH